LTVAVLLQPNVLLQAFNYNKSDRLDWRTSNMDNLYTSTIQHHFDVL